MPKVTTIPATKNKFTAAPLSSFRKRRVAGYARVSTDTDEQLTSYEAQVEYYTNYIKRNPEWEFVKVYTDEGISGLNTKKRDGFNEMIEDALAGRIDLIVTKSVSRFARNTVDSLTTIRMLKEVGCECFFEKENIFTFDGKGELLLTIMSSLAQEESRSISENVTWGHRKRFADGKVSLPYKHFLGYEKGSDSLPKVVDEEADVVRLIYRLFIDGRTASGICKYLENLEIPTPSGKYKWSQSTVMSILQNEKYKGDALLQKKFTVDFLTKKQKVNEGEIPQYYVEGSHEAIVDADDWDIVQAEIARRKELGKTYSGSSIFSSKLVCADCGGFYGQKVWHSTDAYRRQIWRCNAKFKGESKCSTPTLDTETIKNKFMEAYNLLMPDRDGVIERCLFIRSQLNDCAEIDAELARLNEEAVVVEELIKECIHEKATAVLSKESFDTKYNGLVKRHEGITADIDRLTDEKEKRQRRDRELRIYIKALKHQAATMTEWNDRPWVTLLDHAKVCADGKMIFIFKDGTEKTV